MDYKDKKIGIYWHVHHHLLIEHCYDYNMRADFIKDMKPKREIATRLRLMKSVTGELPVGAAHNLEAYHLISKDQMKDIEELHKKECKNCCWNGKEMNFALWLRVWNWIKEKVNN